MFSRLKIRKTSKCCKVFKMILTPFRLLAWSLRVMLRAVMNVVIKFNQQTAIHGMKYTVLPKVHWIERLFWLIAVSAAGCATVLCCRIQLQRYLAEPTVVSMQRDFRSWNTLYPAITACFEERVDWYKADEEIYRYWNVTPESDNEKYQYYRNFIKLVSDVSFRTNMQSFWTYQNDETVQKIDLLQLALDIYPVNVMDITVADSDQETYWTPVMSEMGICMTFNSKFATYQRLRSDSLVTLAYNEHVTDSMLMRCHYLNRQCYGKFETAGEAVKFFVHSPFDIPDGVSNPTGVIRGGQELNLDFKIIEILASPSVRQLHQQQRKCRFYDEAISSHITAYSYGLCQMHCRGKMALMFCGCKPFFHEVGVLPYGVDVALLSLGAFFLTKLKQPPLADVTKVLGPPPGAETDSGKVVKGIAHRGANLDAPENSLEAFKYCVENGCKFVEFDVHMTNDEQMVLCHDDDLQRLADDRRYISESTWSSIKDLDLARNYHNKSKYPHVKMCLLEEALDYLVANNVHMVIDVKSDARAMVTRLLSEFAKRPRLYELAIVTCFNPFTLFQMRRRDRQIIGGLSFRPYMFSAANFDAARGPTKRRFPDSFMNHYAMHFLDIIYEWTFLATVCARWCGASAVFLHKDIVSPREVAKWARAEMRVVGWSVNAPVDKLYYSRSLHCSYLAGTLVAEPQGALASSADSQANKPLKSDLDDPLEAMSKMNPTSIAEMTLGKQVRKTTSDIIEEHVGMVRKMGEKKVE